MKNAIASVALAIGVITPAQALDQPDRGTLLQDYETPSRGTWCAGVEGKGGLIEFITTTGYEFYVTGDKAELRLKDGEPTKFPDMFFSIAGLTYWVNTNGDRTFDLTESYDLGTLYPQPCDVVNKHFGTSE